jgi:hypothetical protein
MAFVGAKRTPATFLIELPRAVGVAESVRILEGLARTVLFSKVRSMATETYLGTAPIRYGPWAVKFTAAPSRGTAPAEERPLTDNFLRDELAERLQKGPIVFDFFVQFFRDEVNTPIEDTSVAWDPSFSPLYKVAELRILPCDLASPTVSAQSATMERLSFTPWHTTEDHRPLGNIMRARRVAYLRSAAFRGHLPEPDTFPP